MKSLKKVCMLLLAFCFLLCFSGCSGETKKGTVESRNENLGKVSENIPDQESEEVTSVENHISISGPYTKNTKISEVASDPVFGDYGRLIFPVDDWYYSGETLGELILTWYVTIQNP